jgi:hypothetical protein
MLTVKMKGLYQIIFHAHFSNIRFNSHGISVYKKSKDGSETSIMLAHRVKCMHNSSELRANELVDLLCLDKDDVIWIEIATTDRNSRNDEFDSRLTLIFMPSDINITDCLR